VAGNEHGSGNNEIAEAIIELAKVFQNTPAAQMRKITLYDSGNQAIAGFDVIPSQKRYFIVGINSWDRGIAAALAVAPRPGGIAGRGCFGPLNAEWLFAESEPGQIALKHDKKGPVRVLLLSSSAKREPELAIVTNLESAKWTPKDIINMYFERWPEGWAQEFLSGGQEEKSISQAILTVYDKNTLASAMSEFLQNACLSLFCPGVPTESTGQLLPSIFALGAKIIPEKDFLRISFILDPSKPFLFPEILDTAIRIANQADIRNNSGKKIIFSSFKG